jgi:hypothetical protein
MTRKTALIISTIITTFILLLSAGIFVTVHNAAQVNAANDMATVPASDAASASTLDPALVQILQDREAAYQEMINQANARLAQAQQEQQALQAQLAALTQPTITTTVTSPPVASISMEQAAQVAETYLRRKDVYSVESISLKGASVYLVTFSSGDQVYVSLDGNIISVQRAKSVASSNSSHSDDDHESDHEDHRGGDD